MGTRVRVRVRVRVYGAARLGHAAARAGAPRDRLTHVSTYVRGRRTTSCTSAICIATCHASVQHIVTWMINARVLWFLSVKKDQERPCLTGIGLYYYRYLLGSCMKASTGPLAMITKFSRHKDLLIYPIFLSLKLISSSLMNLHSVGQNKGGVKLILVESSSW